jgi:hypothetical protein
MKIFLATALIVGLALTGFCGTTDETSTVAQTQPEQLVTRTYKVTAESFWANLKHLAGTKAGEDNFQMLCRFFKKNGLEIKPPTSIFLNLGPFPNPNEGKNFLFVRATQTNQNKIERLVAAIQNNVQPSQVH